MFVIFYFSRTGLRKSVRNVGFCLLVVALTGVASKFSLYQKSLFSRRQETVEYRRINFQAGLKAFSEHPFFGIGYGGFAKRMREGSLGFDEKTLGSGNENTWLGIAVDMGLIGLLPYVMIFALLIRSNIQILRRYDGEEQFARPLATVALAMIIYTLINATTGDLRFHLYDPCLAFLVQGIAVRLGKRMPEAPANLGGEDLEPIVAGVPDFRVGAPMAVRMCEIRKTGP